MQETEITDKKSLKKVTGKTADFGELATDCVCFANARGGTVIIGIEDGASAPAAEQRIDAALLGKIRKRISELTINVATALQVKTALNGGEMIELTIFPSASTIASTTDGKYYYRVDDSCVPLPPDELLRLLTDKPAFIWETKMIKSAPRTAFDKKKAAQFMEDIRASNRVSDFIKEKNLDELLDYYLMADGDFLTNLGVLWIGHRNDRAKLLYAPTVQFFKFDAQGQRVNKFVWDDFSLNPKELIASIWTEIPDWREGIEISDGIFRKFIPNYEEEVVRELLINALVHRPYTTRGDVFINIYPDRMEIRNPGRLPVGVRPENILHKTIRRNEHLAKVFYDLKLMEREGSGYDRIYEVLLSNGKQAPIIDESKDSVTAIIKKRVSNSEVVSFLNRIDQEFQLRQREMICLGLIAQHNSLSAIEFSNILGLAQPGAIRDWLGRLLELGIVKTKGRTRGVEYFVAVEWLQKTKFKGQTSLKRIEDHRLAALIVTDLATYPSSAIGDIHRRIGLEIPIRRLRTHLSTLVADKKIKPSGDKKWRRYSIDENAPNDQ